MARKKPYNTTVNYVITLNGEFYDDKKSLLDARKMVRSIRTEKGTTVHIIRQVITETVVDIFKPMMTPTWTATELDGEL